MGAPLKHTNARRKLNAVPPAWHAHPPAPGLLEPTRTSTAAALWPALCTLTHSARPPWAIVTIPVPSL